MSEIPVMGVLIVNGVHWLQRMIASVDYPVTELCIINNNGRGQIDAELDELVERPHPFIRKMRVVHMPSNLGVAGGWNLIIKSYLMAPYWFIVSHDIEFSPGLIEEMVLKNQNPQIAMTHIGVSDRDLGSFEAFIIKDWVVQQFGLFDENMYPAYSEDWEYLIRSFGIYWDWATRPYKHGDSIYSQSGGGTRREEPDLVDKTDWSRWCNESEYMVRLYGEEWWTRPYDFLKKNYAGPQQYDLEFCRKKYIGF